MQVLGIEKDLDLVAKADPLGRQLQDSRLPAASKTTVRNPAASVSLTQTKQATPADKTVAQLHRSIKNLPQGQSRSTGTRRDWIKKHGFTDSETLAGLIEPLAPSSKKRR